MTSPSERLRPLRATRQFREFTSQPVDRPLLDAILNVARWSGSSRNSQPWRFIVITDAGMLRAVTEIGLPQTRSLRTATAAIAIVLPVEEGREVGLAYDDGRVAERILIAAGMLDLGAGVAWVRGDVREAVGALLGLPADRFVRTIMALGHPTDAARLPKGEPGTARLALAELVVEERWPNG
jgi:nitroreductase